MHFSHSCSSQIGLFSCSGSDLRSALSSRTMRLGTIMCFKLSQYNNTWQSFTAFSSSDLKSICYSPAWNLLVSQRQVLAVQLQKKIIKYNKINKIQWILLKSKLFPPPLVWFSSGTALATDTALAQPSAMQPKMLISGQMRTVHRQVSAIQLESSSLGEL